MLRLAGFSDVQLGHVGSSDAQLIEEAEAKERSRREREREENEVREAERKRDLELRRLYSA